MEEVDFACLNATLSFLGTGFLEDSHSSFQMKKKSSSWPTNATTIAFRTTEWRQPACTDSTRAAGSRGQRRELEACGLGTSREPHQRDEGALFVDT